MNFLRFLNLMVFICAFNISESQTYDAPKLICVQQQTNNTLTWHTPNVACGAFQSYNIFVSNSKSGPYTLLHTEVDNTATTYTHIITNTNIDYFYYMTSSYDCNGMTSTTSDTISDIPLPKPKLISLSIENGKPLYKWIPILDRKNVHAYYVGIPDVKIVDTIIGRENDSYIDEEFDENSGVYNAYLGVTDSCGGAKGRSPWSFSHKTIFLSLNNNPCEGNIDMTWTPYVGWTSKDGVYAYDVMVTINSNPEKSVARLDSNTRQFIFSDFKFGDTVSVRIRAKSPHDTTIISHSNIHNFISRKTQRPERFVTLSATHIDNDIVEVDFYCDTNSTPKSFGLKKLRTKNGIEISNINSLPFDTISKGHYRLYDSMALHGFQVSYQVLFVDDCNQESESDFSNDNYLTVTQHGLYSNRLEWSESFFHDTINHVLKGFEIYMSEDGGGFNKIEDLDNTTYEYINNVENLIKGQGVFCYKIKAIYSIDTPSYISLKEFETLSNTECITMRTVLWMPNAFKVGGFTPVFKPKLIYWESNNVFTMTIFDRWGNEIFQTTDPYTGWNGVSSKGINASEDTYFYKVNYLGNDGQNITKTGSFLLIR